MATTPRLLSGSTNGRGIIINSTTAASGTVLHTTVTGAGANTFDEVYVNVQNLTTGTKVMTINAGGTASGDKISFDVPAKANGLYPMVPGHRYNGGIILRGYATAAGKLAAHGYVNRTA